MTNPSLEYMRRIRREEQDKLLGLRRERAAKALRSLDLHGGSHAMLSQIAYAIHPHVGAWDAESCDHLRNVLIELIGDAREAASDAQSHCACGAGGCHGRNESKEANDGMAGGSRGMREDSGVSACGRMDGGDFHQEVVGYPSAQYDVLGNERHKVVCELQKLMSGIDDLNSYYQFVGELFDALGIDDCPDDELCWDDRLIALCDRLIHLLGGDQSDDSSPMRQENETGITDELREWVLRRETVEDMLMSMPPQTQRRLTYKGNRLLEMADDIDVRTEAMAHDVKTWRNRAEDMHKERDDACAERDELRAELKELKRFDPDTAITAFGDDNEELRKLLSRAAKLLASAERDRDENYHLWMDCKQKALQSDMTIGGLEDECDELQSTIAYLDEQLKRRKAKCLRYKTHIDQMQGGSKRLRKELRKQEGTYLDLLRDAAMDYKVLQDKLNHVVEVCQSYAEARDA